MTRAERVREILEWVAVIIVAAGMSFLINHLLIVNATVPTSSMETTIMARDRIIGSRLSYLKKDPQRGDIIIFKYPDNESVLYIKRLIGLPGEELLVSGGKVYINGEELDEPYLTVETIGEFGPYKIPEGCYFMMGDNRNDSADSRYWDNTYLHREGMIGKAIFRYWPSVKMLK